MECGHTERLLLPLPIQVLLVRGLEDRCLLIPLTLLDEVILPGAQPAAVLYLGKDLQGSFKCSTCNWFGWFDLHYVNWMTQLKISSKTNVYIHF